MRTMSERVAALARLVAVVEREDGMFVPARGDAASHEAALWGGATVLPRPGASSTGLGFAPGGMEGAVDAGETSAAGSYALQPEGRLAVSQGPSVGQAGARRREMPRLALGVAAVDTVLGGGLDRAGLHEIHAAGTGDAAAAAGFVAALAILALPSPSGPFPPVPDGAAAPPNGLSGRAPSAPAGANRTDAPVGRGGASRHDRDAAHATHGGAIAWIETRFSAAEDGVLWPAGLEDLGLAADTLMRVSVGRIVDALAAAEEALACGALAATVLEIRGPAPALDLVALRRLTLAARRRGRPCLLLRTGATLQPTPALTRWAIAAVPAGATGAATGAVFRRQMGLPAFAATLTRQRAGRTGNWNLEWCADGRCFREPLPQPALSAPADRPAVAIRRRTG